MNNQNHRKEKPRLFEPEKQETPSVPLLRGRRPPLSLPGGRRMRDISFKVQGEWFFSEAGFFRMKFGITELCDKGYGFGVRACF